MLKIIPDPIKIEKPHEKPDVVILLDASGSMAEHVGSVISTFNEYIQSVQEYANTVSLYTFNSNVILEKIYKVKPQYISKLSTKDYEPRDLTPLYDAMGYVMRKFENSERNIQFVTHTDGLENDSREWKNLSSINEYIKSLTAKGWMFVYLGEGLEGARQTSNFNGGVKMNFSAANRKNVMREFSKTTAVYSQTMTNDANVYTSNKHGIIDVDKGEQVNQPPG